MPKIGTKTHLEVHYNLWSDDHLPVAWIDQDGKTRKSVALEDARVYAKRLGLEGIKVVRKTGRD